jgi:uncharacterized protein YndB with AHSA1/START domain
VAARNNAATDSSERALVMTRTFEAPRALVFRLWTDARHTRNWWGPSDYPATFLEMDVRPGGKWRGCLRSTESGKELWQGGVFREVVPPERIAFTFAWEEEGERGLETLVTVSFAEEGGKTEMTFHQTPFQSVAERDGHRGGWTSSFDRLAQYLAAR